MGSEVKEEEEKDVVMESLCPSVWSSPVVLLPFASKNDKRVITLEPTPDEKHCFKEENICLPLRNYIGRELTKKKKTRSHYDSPTLQKKTFCRQNFKCPEILFLHKAQPLIT